jgi:hypothetical protein
MGQYCFGLVWDCGGGMKRRGAVEMINRAAR